MGQPLTAIVLLSLFFSSSDMFIQLLYKLPDSCVSQKYAKQYYVDSGPGRSLRRTDIFWFRSMVLVGVT